MTKNQYQRIRSHIRTLRRHAVASYGKGAPVIIRRDAPGIAKTVGWNIGLQSLTRNDRRALNNIAESVI